MTTCTRILNKEHPLWTYYLKSHREVTYQDAPYSVRVVVDGQDSKEPLHNYKKVPLHLFGDEEDGGLYFAYQYDNGFVTYIRDNGSGGYMEIYPTLEEALYATLCEWLPENAHCDWNDASKEYLFDNQWLVREAS